MRILAPVVLLSLLVSVSALADDAPVTLYARCQAPGMTLDVYPVAGSDLTRDFEAGVLAQRPGGLLPTMVTATVHLRPASGNPAASGAAAFRVDIPAFWGIGNGADSSACTTAAQLAVRSGEIVETLMCLYFVDASVDMTSAALNQAIQNGSAIPVKAHVRCRLARGDMGAAPGEASACQSIQILENQIPVDPSQHICSVD